MSKKLDRTDKTDKSAYSAKSIQQKTTEQVMKELGFSKRINAELGLIKEFWSTTNLGERFFRILVNDLANSYSSGTTNSEYVSNETSGEFLSIIEYVKATTMGTYSMVKGLKTQQQTSLFFGKYDREIGQYIKELNRLRIPEKYRLAVGLSSDSIALFGVYDARYQIVNWAYRQFLMDALQYLDAVSGELENYLKEGRKQDRN